jgi:N-acetyl-gamma-glutamyl-phosphate reductase
MSRLRVGVVGATGYSGAIAARLVAAHPAFELAFCTSDKLSGERVEPQLRVPVADGLRYVPNGEAEARARDCDAVLLATAAEVSAKLLPPLVEHGVSVIDLSGAFRLAGAEDYARWYGFSHPRPDLLARAHYGLPELVGAPPKGAFVANPGCYPTATLLALAPLVREGLVEPTGIVVDAKSGVTGAGRQAKEEYSFGEVDEDLRAYKLLSHQHTPEIERVLSRVSGHGPSKLTFTAHLLPVKRGLLATCYARPRAGASAKAVSECLADAYRGAPFVHAVAPHEVTLKAVAGTNHAVVGATADADVVIAIGAIDNLLKGASGQAVQNLNLLAGLDEATGLSHLHRVHP